MIRAFFITLIMVTAAFPAWAQNKAALCQFLPVKEDFVGADYVPGVDVHGNAVVPADVKEQANGYVDVIRIPVTIDLAKGLNLPLPQGTEMNAPVSMVEVYKNSRVVINGKDITNDAYTYCGKTPFNIDAATVEPEKQPPVPVTKPAKPVKEDIIWGQGY